MQKHETSDEADLLSYSSNEVSWQDLIEGHNRVVILAEPGAGKTSELKSQAQRLSQSGSAAFFLRIELLLDLDVPSALDDLSLISSYSEWLQSIEHGYFFLDSVDEARLVNQAAYDVALRKFYAETHHHEQRMTIVLSCRAEDWRGDDDLRKFEAMFPPPTHSRANIDGVSELEGSSDIEVDTETGEIAVLKILPLNHRQMVTFIENSSIDNAAGLVSAIERAEDSVFTERPQDLIELIAYWSEHKQLDCHKEMLSFTIGTKLKESNPSYKNSQNLGVAKLRAGAETLAAAVTFQRRSSILLEGANPEPGLIGPCVNPTAVLPQWSGQEIASLLNRALYDQPSFGTLRFHHRSSREYLAASWLSELIRQGKSQRDIQAFIFAERYGERCVIPSMAPIAAWLAVFDGTVREKVATISPETLFQHGDPASLPPDFRKQLLEKHARSLAESGKRSASISVTMLQRLAHRDLGATIVSLLEEFEDNREVSILMLRLLWHGGYRDGVNSALKYSLDTSKDKFARQCAARVIIFNGEALNKGKLLDSLTAEPVDSRHWDALGDMCSELFPDIVTPDKILSLIQEFPTPESFPTDAFVHAVERLCSSNERSNIEAEYLLHGLESFTQRKPYVEDEWCHVSKHYAWLLPNALLLINQLLERKEALCFSTTVLGFIYRSYALRDFTQIVHVDVQDTSKLINAWPELGHKLFWYVVEAIRNTGGKTVDSWHLATWRIDQCWQPGIGQVESLLDDLTAKSLLDDRLVALSAVFAVYRDHDKPDKLLDSMTRAVSGDAALEGMLNRWLNPPPDPTDEREINLRASHDKKIKDEEKIRAGWIQKLKNNPSQLESLGDPREGTVTNHAAWLSREIKKKSDGADRLGLPDWKILLADFGEAVATTYKRACQSYWREYDPLSYPGYRTSDSIPWARIVGLSGLIYEYDNNPNWCTHFTSDEVRRAASYSVLEMNGFPAWFESLHTHFPHEVSSVLIEEIAAQIEGYSSGITGHLERMDRSIRRWYVPSLCDLLQVSEAMDKKLLRDILSILLSNDSEERSQQVVKNRALTHLDRSLPPEEEALWLCALFNVDGLAGVGSLLKALANRKTASEKGSLMEVLVVSLASSHWKAPDDDTKSYDTLEVFEKLIPLIFTYIDPMDDIDRSGGGVYSPVARDDAQRCRDNMIGKLTEIPGKGTYDLLLQLSKKWREEWFVDLARKRAAADAEFQAWSDQDVVNFSQHGVKTPRSERELFDIACNRLDDLKQHLEQSDYSTAGLWRRVELETEMRNALVDELSRESKGMYTVSPEEENAAGKRTDFRFHSTCVDNPIPVELKLAEKKGWTLNTLKERMKNQLVGQYLRQSTHGIFLLVLTVDSRSWRDSETKKKLDFENLVKELNLHAGALMKRHSHVEALTVVGIDLHKRYRH